MQTEARPDPSCPHPFSPAQVFGTETSTCLNKQNVLLLHYFVVSGMSRVRDFARCVHGAQIVSRHWAALQAAEVAPYVGGAAKHAEDLTGKLTAAVMQPQASGGEDDAGGLANPYAGRNKDAFGNWVPAPPPGSAHSSLEPDSHEPSKAPLDGHGSTDVLGRVGQSLPLTYGHKQGQGKPTPTRCTTLISRVSHQHNRCGQAQVA